MGSGLSVVGKVKEGLKFQKSITKVIGSGLEAVFEEVYKLLEEMEDKNGSTRLVGEGKNKPDLDKVTEQEVKRYWIPDPKNTKDSIRVTEFEGGIDYRKPIDNGYKSRSWSDPTDAGGN